MRAAHTRPEDVDPRGRLDVVAFRLLEKLAESQCPQEWPMLSDLTWETCQKIQPAGLAPEEEQQCY